MIRLRSQGLASALASALALALVVTPAEAQRQGKPRLDAGRVAIEALGGAYAGIGGFLMGRVVGESVGASMGVESDVTRRRVGYTTGAVFATAATAGFVYAVGTIGDTSGDFNATLLGAGLGLLTGAAVDRLIFDVGPPQPGKSTGAQWAAINVLALLPSIGATIGFNSTRRFQ
ncbi:MAG: hypothetical protein ACYC0B_03595 [Gemmatimonadaceae bacterium]